VLSFALNRSVGADEGCGDEGCGAYDQHGTDLETGEYKKLDRRPRPASTRLL
jgi:hypothetical protein